jgi:Galactose-3-O-sulfotransferase
MNGPNASLGADRFDAKRPDHVIFIHIPKAAGRTMNSIVARQYSRHELLQIEGGLGKTRIPDSERATQAKFVIGHVHYGLHRHLPGTSSYMTMLRDPVDRVLSLYRYIVSTPQHALHQRLANVSLLDFASGSDNMEEIENGQTRQIAGVTTGVPDAQSLAVAKRHLVERFVAVGIMERFDESVILFKRRLRWRMPYYVPKNVTQTLFLEEPGVPAIKIIESRNTLDAELYRHACDLFEEQVSRAGPLFNAEVSVFRLLNSAASTYRRGREWARNTRD